MSKVPEILPTSTASSGESPRLRLLALGGQGLLTYGHWRQGGEIEVAGSAIVLWRVALRSEPRGGRVERRQHRVPLHWSWQDLVALGRGEDVGLHAKHSSGDGLVALGVVLVRYVGSILGHIQTFLLKDATHGVRSLPVALSSGQDAGASVPLHVLLVAIPSALVVHDIAIEVELRLNVGPPVFIPVVGVLVPP